LHNTEQLQKDWETLLDDTDYAQQLAQNARTFVQEHFSAQRMADEYYELFSTMLNEQRHG
jgi:hypothetical protein